MSARQNSEHPKPILQRLGIRPRRRLGQNFLISDQLLDRIVELAGVGPEDLSVVELHDASAPAEITTYEKIGLCGEGQGAELIRDGSTKLGGRLPVNPSGGLLRKGHPVGATGIAQIVELTEQLQGRAGKRQVEAAKIALAHNGGGSLGSDAAAMCVTILSR